MDFISFENAKKLKEKVKVSKAVFDVNAQCCDIMNHLIKEETMKEQIMTEDITLEKSVMCTFSEVVEGKQRLRIAMKEGFELKEENGFFFVYRKKTEYPKTYDECCDTLKVPNDERYIDIDVPLDYNKFISTFTKLLICRDAYWKIAGEEMGLGKPWKPDWESLDKKYNIYNYRGNIKYDYFTVTVRCLLVFPTEEMRDAFYENFKDLIVVCKELL